MLHDQQILAVIPARSGSIGIPDKNLQEVGGRSLIALAAGVVRSLPWLDDAIISTDSDLYATEAERAGLRAPFRRPPELSGSDATAFDTMLHALRETEDATERKFDIILILEPTSPNRVPDDVERAVRMLIDRPELDSVVTVSEVGSKNHPLKILRIDDGGLLEYVSPDAASITSRQQLVQRYYARNGACYALRRRCLTQRLGIITSQSAALVIDRPLANIDTPIDLQWARFLWDAAVERR